MLEKGVTLCQPTIHFTEDSFLGAGLSKITAKSGQSKMIAAIYPVVDGFSGMKKVIKSW